MFPGEAISLLMPHTSSSCLDVIVCAVEQFVGYLHSIA